MSGVLLASNFSDTERQLLMERIYGLLRRQTAKYLSGDSTSVSVETATELLRSIVFTLRFALDETGTAEKQLLSCDLAELLLQGQRLLQKKLADTKRLWERACLTAPQIPNAFFQDTLKGFDAFFKHYDWWYFAHQIPCPIDYPLCIAVPETLQGVSYVEQWLRKLLMENWLLSRFPQQAVRNLLSALAPDYWDYPLNLCEQPMMNAVGSVLLKRSAFSLQLSADDCERLCAFLRGCTDLQAELNRAAARAAAELCAPKEAEHYLQAVIADALPRLQAAIATGNLRAVFVSQIQ